MPTITLEPGMEQRIADRAKRDGVSKADLVRTLIEEGLNDLDDTQMAADRLGNPMPPLTNAQARRALGLDD